MSSETSTESPFSGGADFPEQRPDSLQPWQLFTLAGLVGATITVHVRDAGPGMSEAHLTEAFDRFWRAPDAPHDGSGLGLTIVAHLATASGGTARLARRPGVGLDAMIELQVATSSS